MKILDFLFSGVLSTVQGTKQFNLIFFYCPVYLGRKYIALLEWEHNYFRVNIYIPNYGNKPARSPCCAHRANPGKVLGWRGQKAAGWWDRPLLWSMQGGTNPKIWALVSSVQGGAGAPLCCQQSCSLLSAQTVAFSGWDSDPWVVWDPEL